MIWSPPTVAPTVNIEAKTRIFLTVFTAIFSFVKVLLPVLGGGRGQSDSYQSGGYTRGRRYDDRPSYSNGDSSYERRCVLNRLKFYPYVVDWKLK